MTSHPDCSPSCSVPGDPRPAGAFVLAPVVTVHTDGRSVWDAIDLGRVASGPGA